MPLVRTIQTSRETKIGIWKITESEEFFTGGVKAAREVRHPAKRLQHLAARYLLERLESSLVTGDIRITDAGKPFLPGDPFYFSLSHSGDHAAAIVTRQGPAGIDLERITPRIERLSGRFLTADERAFLSAGDLAAQLTLCWCAKEAVVKWFGGAGIDFQEHIRLSPFAPADSGQLQVLFSKGGTRALLKVPYVRVGDYQLAWVTGTDD